MRDGPNDENESDDDPGDVGIAERRPAEFVYAQVGYSEVIQEGFTVSFISDFASQTKRQTYLSSGFCVDQTTPPARVVVL